MHSVFRRNNSAGGGATPQRKCSALCFSDRLAMPSWYPHDFYALRACRSTWCLRFQIGICMLLVIRVVLRSNISCEDSHRRVERSFIIDNGELLVYRDHHPNAKVKVPRMSRSAWHGVGHCRGSQISVLKFWMQFSQTSHLLLSWANFHQVFFLQGWWVIAPGHVSTERCDLFLRRSKLCVFAKVDRRRSAKMWLQNAATQTTTSVPNTYLETTEKFKGVQEGER